MSGSQRVVSVPHRSEGLEDDGAWLKAFRRGDRGALARVFRAYAHDITRVIRGARSRVPEHEVEALVHEVFVRAFAEKARLQYDGIRPYGAWLSTIARNLITDRARRERRSGAVHVEDIEALADDVERDPTWKIESEQLVQILQTFEAGLDGEDRALFAARMKQQLSISQTQKALGWSEITIRRRDTRLRARLLELLRREGFLKNATVRIGTSLLGRSDPQSG